MGFVGMGFFFEMEMLTGEFRELHWALWEWDLW